MGKCDAEFAQILPCASSFRMETENFQKREWRQIGISCFPMNWIDPITKNNLPDTERKDISPKRLFNMLALLLGWHAKRQSGIIFLEELVNQFSLDRVSQARSKSSILKKQNGSISNISEQNRMRELAKEFIAEDSRLQGSGF